MKKCDIEFVQQFEKHSLDLAKFDHIGHIRIAWIYLVKYPLNKAIEKVNEGIASYANSKGATDKFQLTLTEATVRIMALRVKPTKIDTFEAFMSANKDLITELPKILEKHYSKETLYSDKAKKSFVIPDLEPIPHP